MARLQKAANTPGNDTGLEDFTPIPVGEYVGMVTKSEFKATKAKTGHYLQLIWKVIDGEYKGRTLYDNLNLDNPNPVAVEIANKALNSICKACNKVGVEDSEEIHGIPVLLTVSIQAATDQNPASNNIKAYSEASKSPTGGMPMSEGAGQDQSTEPAGDGAVSGGTPESGARKKLPWEK